MDSIEVYKKIPIYRDDTSNDVFIYRRKHGEGRINFPTVSKCKKYIDDHEDEIKCSRNVVLKKITAGCHGGKKKPVKASEDWPIELDVDYDDDVASIDPICDAYMEAVDELNIDIDSDGYGDSAEIYFLNEDGEEIARIPVRKENYNLLRSYYKSKNRENFKDLIKVWLKKLCNI